MGKRLRKNICVCRDCGFVDSHGRDEEALDKCPYCGGDDWQFYKKCLGPAEDDA